MTTTGVEVAIDSKVEIPTTNTETILGNSSIFRPVDIVIPQFDLWYAINCTLEKIDCAGQQFEISGWLNFFWIDKDLESKPYFSQVGKFVAIEDDGENQPIKINALFENAVLCEHLEQPVFRYKMRGVHVRQRHCFFMIRM